MSLYSMCPPIPTTSYVAVFFLTEAKKTIWGGIMNGKGLALSDIVYRGIFYL